MRIKTKQSKQIKIQPRKDLEPIAWIIQTTNQFNLKTMIKRERINTVIVYALWSINDTHVLERATMQFTIN